LSLICKPVLYEVIHRISLSQVKDWLKSGGKAFIHVFVHKHLGYHFETEVARAPAPARCTRCFAGLLSGYGYGMRVCGLFSTEGWTRRVHFVREGVGGGGRGALDPGVKRLGVAQGDDNWMGKYFFTGGTMMNQVRPYARNDCPAPKAGGLGVQDPGSSHPNCRSDFLLGMRYPRPEPDALCG
jgi:hypothetical protein